MKGKAVLTLCDAESGRVKKQLEESNMVTHALDNIFRFPRNAFYQRWNLGNFFSAALPMWKKLLGGIMLLGNTLEEDADKCMPPADVIPIGNAGDAYSGANVMRGSLNLNETYQTENGYHFTWDFASDKANGTIRSIAMTSRYFGNAGFAGSELTDGRAYMDPMNLELTNSPQVYYALAQGTLVGSFEANTFTFCRSDNDHNILFDKYRIANPNALKINDTIWGNNMVPYETITAQNPMDIRANLNYFYDPDKKTLFFFDAEADDTKTITTVRYAGYNPINGAVKETGRISVEDGSSSSLGMALYRGRLYRMNDTSLSIYDMSGKLLKRIDENDCNDTRFYVLDGSVLCHNAWNDYHFERWCDSDTDCICRSLNAKQLYGSEMHLPYTLVSRNENGMSACYLMLRTDYMATINNLSEPIVKTNNDTLKISYDIVN